MVGEVGQQILAGGGSTETNANLRTIRDAVGAVRAIGPRKSCLGFSTTKVLRARNYVPVNCFAACNN